MPSYQIDCPEIDSDLACERFPTRAEAEQIAEWVIDMEPFAHAEVVEVDGEPTTTAAEWMTDSGSLPPVRDCDRAICESAMEAMNLAREAGDIVRVRLFSGDCDGARVAVGPSGLWIVEDGGSDDE